MTIYIYTSSARSGFARMKLESLNRASIVEINFLGLGSARRQLSPARFKNPNSWPGTARLN